MVIKIVIEDDDGEMLQTSTSLSVESAVQELYRFERNQDKDKTDEIENDTI